LVGDGPLRRELADQAARLGVSDAVELAGLQVDVRPLLWRASVFALASHREAMPLALLEAMAAGLACVAVSVGEIPEVLEHGRCGMLVPPADADALGAAMLRLLEDDEAREALATAARSRVESAYSLRSCVDRVEEAYREAVRS
jgi:glycosyltransferase involved in cell wall biosynthesis